MRIAIHYKKAQTLAALRAILDGREDLDVAVPGGELASFIQGGTVDLPYDLLLVESEEMAAELELLEGITCRHPRLAVVLLAADPGKDFLLQAMRAGAREVIALPLRDEALVSVVERMRQRSGFQAARRRGKVLVFQSSKGGSGGTFLASNFAYSLSQQGRRTALIDLNLQFGDAAMHVCDGVGGSVADVAQQIQRLDGDFLMSSMVRVTSHFSVLAAPESPDQAVGIRPDFVGRLLEVARERFDYVVVDVGRTIDPICVRVLDEADTIMLVVQLTLPFIRDAKRLLAVFDSLNYPRSKVRLVVNRYQKGGEITLGDVEATLGIPVVHTVPNSFQAVAASVNQGKPMAVLHPRDRVTQSLTDMVRQLEPRTEAAAGGRWFSRLFPRTA